MCGSTCLFGGHGPSSRISPGHTSSLFDCRWRAWGALPPLRFLREGLAPRLRLLPPLVPPGASFARLPGVTIPMNSMNPPLQLIRGVARHMGGLFIAMGGVGDFLAVPVLTLMVGGLSLLMGGQYGGPSLRPREVPYYIFLNRRGDRSILGWLRMLRHLWHCLLVVPLRRCVLCCMRTQVHLPIWT
jgi:hypothetical protein